MVRPSYTDVDEREKEVIYPWPIRVGAVFADDWDNRDRDHRKLWKKLSITYKPFTTGKRVTYSTKSGTAKSTFEQFQVIFFLTASTAK